MAFRGLDTSYSRNELVTPLALVYSRATGRLIGVRCTEPLGYYTTSFETMRSVVVPLNMLDRFWFSEVREGKLLIHGTRRLSRVYDDNTIIEECVQALIVGTIEEFYSSDRKPACRYKRNNRALDPVIVTLLPTIAGKTVTIRAEELSTLKEKGVEVYNIDLKGYITNDAVQIDLSEADEFSQLGGGILGIDRLELRDSKISFPDDYFNTPTRVVQDCSYGAVSCTINNNAILQNLVWKGTYDLMFSLKVTNCPSLRNITLPTLGDGEVSLTFENLNNTTINIGFDAGSKTDIVAGKILRLHMANCKGLKININPECKIRGVSIEIVGTMDIENITWGRKEGSVLLEKNYYCRGVFEFNLENSSVPILSCNFFKNDNSTNIIHKIVNNTGVIFLEGEVIAESIKCSGQLYTNPKYEKTRIQLNQLEATALCIGNNCANSPQEYHICGDYFPDTSKTEVSLDYKEKVTISSLILQDMSAETALKWLKVFDAEPEKLELLNIKGRLALPKGIRDIGICNSHIQITANARAQYLAACDSIINLQGSCTLLDAISSKIQIGAKANITNLSVVDSEVAVLEGFERSHMDSLTLAHSYGTPSILKNIDIVRAIVPRFDMYKIEFATELYEHRGTPRFDFFRDRLRKLEDYIASAKIVLDYSLYEQPDIIALIKDIEQRVNYGTSRPIFALIPLDMNKTASKPNFYYYSPSDYAYLFIRSLDYASSVARECITHRSELMNGTTLILASQDINEYIQKEIQEITQNRLMGRDKLTRATELLNIKTNLATYKMVTPAQGVTVEAFRAFIDKKIAEGTPQKH